jgi:hypothetical protein
VFIDEAYYLYRAESERDYGQEAIEILLQVMENQRDKVVVILAGYKDRMDSFFESNPGMSSRIAHHLHFEDYELGELEAIGQLMLGQAHYYLPGKLKPHYLSGEAKAALHEYLIRRIRQPRFANARSVRNAQERARLRHANRLLADPEHPWGRDDLMRIEPVDILASDVFAELGAGRNFAGTSCRTGAVSGADRLSPRRHSPVVAPQHRIARTCPGRCGRMARSRRRCRRYRLLRAGIRGRLPGGTGLARGRRRRF